jgi:hypothetical protein
MLARSAFVCDELPDMFWVFDLCAAIVAARMVGGCVLRRRGCARA